jgi:hypothetical protein
MNDRDQRRYDRATRVQTFGEDNAADFDPNSKATALFAGLDGVIEQLDDAKAAQTPNRVSKTTLIDALSMDLKNIARTARCIEFTENGFATPYRLPDTPAESALTTHADAVLATLEDQSTDTASEKTAKAALRARFQAYELPTNFVASLRADRDALADANKANQSGTNDSVESTRLIDALLGQANSLISELDAIMFNKYTRQPEKLRAWQSASHVERNPRHEKKSAPAPASA